MSFSTSILIYFGYLFSSSPTYTCGVDPGGPVRDVEVVRAGRVLALGPLPVTAGTALPVAFAGPRLEACKIKRVFIYLVYLRCVASLYVFFSITHLLTNVTLSLRHIRSYRMPRIHMSIGPSRETNEREATFL